MKPLDKLFKEYNRKNKLALTLSAVGVLIFLIVVITFSFRGRFGLLFPTRYSQAAGPNDWAQLQKDPQRSGYSAETLGTQFIVKWTYAFQPERVYPQVQAIVYSNSVYVGTEMGNLYAIDTANGSKRWSFSTGSPILASVAADNGKVYVGAMDGALYAVDTTTGAQVWKTQLSGRFGISTSPLLADNKVMIGARDGKFYGVDLNSGTILWTYNAGAPILMSAAWDNGKAFFGSMDMYVHAVNTSNGTGAWKSAKIAGLAFKQYWPVVHQGKVIISPDSKIIRANSGLKPAFPFTWMGPVNQTWLTANGPTIATGSATLVSDFVNAQNTVMTTYQSNPSNFTKTAYVLDGSTGQEAFAIPHFDQQSHNGAAPPPCVDSSGYLVMPVMFIRSGWGRLNLANQRYVDILYDGKTYSGAPFDLNNSIGVGNPAGMGNDDEMESVSCSNNLILGIHYQERNANYTGAFDLVNRKWTQIAAGYTNKQMDNNTSSGGANPASISNGVIYHISFHELIARDTGAPPTPTPTSTPVPTLAPTIVPTATPSATLENLGNPFKARFADNSPCVYARNVWDMASWNNKLYLGHGNSSSSGPCVNAGGQSGGGGIDVFTFDPSNSQFGAESKITEEQIDKFSVINFSGIDKLTIPGHDTLGANNVLGYYTKESAGWTAASINPTGGAHTYDMANFASKILAVGDKISVSDTGSTWLPINCLDQSGNPILCVIARAYKLFELGGKLYVSGQVQTAVVPPVNVCMLEYQTGVDFKPVAEASASAIVANSANDCTNRVIRALTFSGQTLYIVGQGVNDHQWTPVSLRKATNLAGGSTQINLPGSAKPWDILVSGGKAYVLASAGSGPYTISVFSSSDLNNWTEEFNFSYPTFARSFEYLNSYFYFGMGSEVSPLPNETGDILRRKFP